MTKIKTFGSYGYRVTIWRNPDGGRLYLRWTEHGGTQRKSRGHTDTVKATRQAKELMARLVLGAQLDAEPVTVARMLAEYERHVTPTKGSANERDSDGRRVVLWASVLGGSNLIEAIDTRLISRYITLRRQGRLKVTYPGGKPMRLTTTPSETTIGKDIAFLRAVLYWAMTQKHPNGARWLTDHPLRGFTIPKTAHPARPVASFDRFLATRPHCDAVDPQQLLKPLLMLVEGLGWRISALCQLRASDIDTRKGTHTPRGRIHKYWKTDKEEVDQWVPMSADVRAAVNLLRQRSPVVGDRYLFPAPRAKGKPWQRSYASTLLRRAEDAAGLEKIPRGLWHPYRRKWATERKGHPDKDVAETGGWKSLESLQTAYQQPDEETMLDVVSEPRKLREVK